MTVDELIKQENADNFEIFVEGDKNPVISFYKCCYYCEINGNVLFQLTVDSIYEYKTIKDKFDLNQTNLKIYIKRKDYEKVISKQLK